MVWIGGLLKSFRTGLNRCGPSSTLKRLYCNQSITTSGQIGYHFHPGFTPENVEKFTESFLVFEDVVNRNEEESFMNEMEPHLKRHIYEKDHWDDAIKGFRETERKIFRAENTNVVQRIKRLGFPAEGKESKTLPYTHVLDLADWGHIKAHTDSSRVGKGSYIQIHRQTDTLTNRNIDKQIG